MYSRQQVMHISCCVQSKSVEDAKIETLLDILARRPDDCFDKFCDALVANEQEEVVDKYLKPKKSLPESVKTVDNEKPELRMLNGMPEAGIQWPYGVSLALITAYVRACIYIYIYYIYVLHDI